MRIAALLVALMIILGAAPACAADVTAAQGVIRAQEQAFARDDAAAAYSHAAPAIREIFPAPDIFMSMVQNGYAPVYRHKSFEFGESRSEGNWVSQHVHIVSRSGFERRIWLSVPFKSPRSSTQLAFRPSNTGVV